MVASLPFGRHKGEALADVPLNYLTWLLGNVKLSTGLRAAVAAEVERRGGTAPPPPPPAPVPRCQRCGPGGKVRYLWLEMRNKRRAIRRECQQCGGSLGFAPLVEPYTTLADAAASPTAVLDALLLAEQFGCELQSDGAKADFASSADWLKASQQLRDRLRQCAGSLGAMLGDTRG